MTNRMAYLILLITGAIFVRYSAMKLKFSQFLLDSTHKNDSRAAADKILCLTGHPCTYPDVVDLRVVVLTFNRAVSLSKLLRSLDTLVLDGSRAALEIWIDRGRNDDIDERTLEAASAFIWKRGPTRVHTQTHRAGIMGQWIDTWRPQDDSDTELGLILEDDLSVSPYAYRWLNAVHRAYRQRSDFGGATILSQPLKVLSEHPKGPLLAPKNDTVFMYKGFGTSGWAPRPLHWRRFQDWFHQHKPAVVPHFRPYIPDSLATTWYKIFERSGRQHTMWEMWFVYYMHIEQLYAIYSNLNVYTGGKENCLGINRREPGLHFKGNKHENECRLLTMWKDEYIRFPKNIVRLHWNGSPMGDRLY